MVGMRFLPVPLTNVLASVGLDLACRNFLASGYLSRRLRPGTRIANRFGFRKWDLEGRCLQRQGSRRQIPDRRCLRRLELHLSAMV